MIKHPEVLQEFEDDFIRDDGKLSFDSAIKLFTYMGIASPEDLIVHKIFAGGPRDREDVRTVLLKNPDVDLLYRREWLKKFDEPSEEKGF